MRIVSHCVTLLSFCVCVGAASPAFAQKSVYVSSNGSDANPCTQAAPCATIGAGEDAAAPGDNVIVTGTFSGTVTLTKSGSAGKPITYQGNSGSCPTTSNAGRPDAVHAPPRKPNPSTRTGAWVIRASYVTVDCFRIAAVNADALDVQGTNRTTIRLTNNFITSGGIRARVPSDSPPSTFVSNLYVGGNYLDTAGLITSSARSSVFELNESFNPPSADYATFWGEDVVYRRNYFHGKTYCEGCHSDGFQTHKASGTADQVARRITFDGNTIFNAHQGIIVEGSSHEGGKTHDDLTIINNVFKYGPVGSRMSWCVLISKASNTKVYNNVCTALMGFRGTGANAVVKNNIFIGSGVPAIVRVSTNFPDPPPLTMTHNLFYSAGRTFTSDNIADVGTFTGNILNRDPRLVAPDLDDFAIGTVGSPAVDAGAAVGVTTDRNGNARHGAPDVGAYESGYGAPPSPSNVRVIR